MSLLQPGYDDAAYLRVASMAIGAYELICTLPSEYRFYRQQVYRRALSQQCALFILIRYLSVVVVVVSNVGFFGRFPSLEACRRFMLVSPVFKALQTLVSQLILSTRTYTISRKSRWVFWALIATLLLTVPVEFYTNIHGRTQLLFFYSWFCCLKLCITQQRCTSGNAGLRIAWINYLAAMIFDVVVICISSGYLWHYSATASRISHFLQTLLYEGLGYFVVLTAVNVFNLVLYLKESEATQSTGASLGYVVIFIMSQRILIRQREYADKYTSSALSSNTYEVSISHRLDTTREINEALRSQFESCRSKASCYQSFSQDHTESQSWTQARSMQRRSDLEEADGNLTGYNRESRIEPRAQTPSGTGTESGLDVQVRVERTVTVARIPRAAALGRESYKKPRVMWET